ncbi:FUSC family protein [Burkholderia sp. Bp9002]|nr:FUSC family protein [Burkholderia sp. Bp9002]
MHAAASRRMSNAVDTESLVRALAVTSTPVALYATTGDPNWLRVVLVTISLLIGIERVGLAPFGVLAQAVAIHAGFLLLSLCWTWKPAFVMGCTALAAVTVALSLAGSRLRSLGNFVFIPSLYLACEMSEAHADIWALAPYLTVSALPPLALSCADALRDEGGRLRLLMRWRKPSDLGSPSGRTDAACAITAVTTSVALAATLVAWLHLPYGQWAIWSAASVVTVDAGLAKAKLRDRGIGVLIGVPAGLVAGLLLSRCTLTHILIALVTPVTLIAFRRYTTGFAARCASIACASWVMQHSLAAAADRIVDVIVGGVIGVACVIAVNRAAPRHRH